MKTHISYMAALLVYATVTLGAMSNATALTKAQKLFGPLAYLVNVKATTDANTTKQIRVTSTHCRDPFMVIAEGLGTWEAAFYQVPADTVKGPFSGAVTLTQAVYDDVAVMSWQFVFDGVPTSNRVPQPTKFAVAQMTWDTRQWANGVHVICGLGVDSDGYVSKTKAWLVLVDQSKPSIGTGIDFSDRSGQPLVSGM